MNTTLAIKKNVGGASSPHQKNVGGASSPSQKSPLSQASSYKYDFYELNQ